MLVKLLTERCDSVLACLTIEVCTHVRQRSRIYRCSGLQARGARRCARRPSQLGIAQSARSSHHSWRFSGTRSGLGTGFVSGFTSGFTSGFFSPSFGGGSPTYPFS